MSQTWMPRLESLEARDVPAVFSSLGNFIQQVIYPPTDPTDPLPPPPPPPPPDDGSGIVIILPPSDPWQP